jgi:hypothetical protein
MSEEEKFPVKLPEKTKIAFDDLIHQLGTTWEAVLTEALLALLPTLEQRRKILEAHTFPKNPLAEKGH